MKKIVFFLICILSFLWGSFSQVSAVWQNPGVVCSGLPGCPKENFEVDIKWKQATGDAAVFQFLSRVIAEWIKYVAVVAVISLMISGIMFLLASGEEEKITKARKWIIWSLWGVLLSVSAWSIINLLNSFSIN